MLDLYFNSQERVFAPHLKMASDVPDDCKVYVFYVPGMIAYEDLKKALGDLGQAAGKNIFVGFWDLDAKPYSDILAQFQIKKSPAVLISGNPAFSTDGRQPSETAFAKIDNPNLLNDLAKTSSCIMEICNLFLQGEVKKALSSARSDQWHATLTNYISRISGKISQFLKDHSVTFDILKGTITLSPASGSKASSTTSKPKTQ